MNATRDVVSEVDADKMDVRRVSRARVLVIGAGALGAEVIRGLVSAGFMHMTVADAEAVGDSDVSGSSLFGADDIGVSRSAAVTEKALLLEPGASVTAIRSPVRKIDGWNYDVIIGCQEDVGARLLANFRATSYGIPYVDATADGHMGRIQTVLPGGPCLECGMFRTRTGTRRASVHMPSPERGTAEAVAALEVEEALKIAGGRQDLCTRGVRFYRGDTGTCTTLSINRDPKCPNHRRR